MKMLDIRNLSNKQRIIIAVILLAIFFLSIVLELALPQRIGEDKLVRVERGLGSDKTGQVLKDAGIIKNKWLFVFYVWIKGYGSHLQAGDYLLNPKMSLFKVANIISRGEVAPNSIKITIPEGWTNKQIERRLIAYGILAQGDKLPQEKEGYLFPDTYYFERNSSIDIVVKKMSDNFIAKIGEISKDLLADSSMKLRNAVIMASILEREVKSDEDRAIVSGIFWKRIEDNHPLESCATIAYILGVEKKQYTYEDTRIESPYNTYLNAGFPPTPINNPGLSAIKAALYPQESDYYFFLSAPDGTTIFSKTFEEHNANKAKYLD